MNRDRFSVATFNLYNLQLPGRAHEPGPAGVDGGGVRPKLTWIGAQLKSWMPTSSVCRSSGIAMPWPMSSLRRDWIRHTSSSRHPPTASRIICAALVRHGLRVGDPCGWIASRMPCGCNPRRRWIRSRPGIYVNVPGFSRPVLRMSIALRDDHPNVEVFVAHLKSKLPIRIDTEDWYTQDPAKYKATRPRSAPPSPRSSARPRQQPCGCCSPRS